eukprot:scaffold248392_cov40-Cyclotella_meneghiniana.AAC.3
MLLSPLPLLLILLVCSSTNALQQPRQQAVVVGCGPVGVAASLVLCELSHHNSLSNRASKHKYDVTLLDSSPSSSSQAHYDPTKAFLYNVNSRGQTLTKMFPSMHEKLVERSVVSKGFAGTTITIVPADPKVAIPISKKNEEEKKATSALDTDASNSSNSSSNNNNNIVMPSGEKATAVGYWIPRHEMVKLMMEEIDLHNQREGSGGTITLCTGQECILVSPSNTSKKDGGVIVKAVSTITTDASSKEEKEYIANLVIGADGMNSNVRFCLAHAAPGTWSSNCVPSSQFQLKQYTSPASYLRIKVLQLPPRFQIKNVD